MDFKSNYQKYCFFYNITEMDMDFDTLSLYLKKYDFELKNRESDQPNVYTHIRMREDVKYNLDVQTHDSL